MKVSMVLSIHNRSKLFSRALDGFIWQTMPRSEWEVIIVDDMSTENMFNSFSHMIGKINIKHVKIDHTKHALFKERNPNWKNGQPKNWFHTPALSINVGTYCASGNVIGLCHPEILHALTNFANAHKLLQENKVYLFGTTWIGTQEHNKLLDNNPNWTVNGWINYIKHSHLAHKLNRFRDFEMYWYTSFLPKIAIETIGGVDFSYLNGVAAEDDDFRDRIMLAGWKPVYTKSVEGFHQDHSDETESHRIRTSKEWASALQRNRELYYARKEKRTQYPIPANVNYDWTAKECIVSMINYPIDEGTEVNVIDKSPITGSISIEIVPEPRAPLIPRSRQQKIVINPRKIQTMPRIINNRLKRP